MDRNKRIVAVAFSVEDLQKKVDQLKAEGYSESDMHIVAQDKDRLSSFQSNTAIETEQVNSTKNKFKSFITGESSVREGIKSLDLSEEATARYTKDLANGGLLLYVEGEYKGVLDVINDNDRVDKVETGLRDHEGHISPSDNEFVNAVDNNFDEQEDRFARGESFMEDPTLLKEEGHFSFTTKEKTSVERTRAGNDEAEKHSSPDKKY